MNPDGWARAQDEAALCATAGHLPTGPRVMAERAAQPVSVACDCGRVVWVPLGAKP